MAIMSKLKKNEFMSGFVAIIGPPNAGKSTLLNRLLGEKITIVSPRPQTTRNRILGILHGKGFQLAFLDTPGIHKSRTPLHRSMVSSASELFNEVDILLILVDATSFNNDETSLILNNLKKNQRPVILAINKIDKIPRVNILPTIAYFTKKHDFQSIVPVSALTGDGIDSLIHELKGLIKPGPEFYPKGIITDQSEAFTISEIIREKIYLNTKHEIPYSSAVTVQGIIKDISKDMISISATIHVEAESQKAIIIGRGGKMIKKIGSSSRSELEKIYATHIFLDLKATVEKNWSKDTKALKKLGY